MKHSPFAGAAASFAHLLGRRPSGKRAEDEDRKNKESKRAEDDEDKDPDAEDDEDKDKEAEGEDDDADAKAEDDPDAEDEDEDKEAKKANGGKGKGYAAGRADERKRCAAIFASEHAAGLPHVAAQLAFTTGLSASEAIAVMAGVAVSAPAQGKRGGLADRMASTPIPSVGADGGKQADASTPAGMAAKMTAVYDRLIRAKK